MKKGIEYFQQAIDRDPNYALAYAGIAECYNSLGIYQLLPPTEVLPKAKAAAERALASDETLAEAHAAMAHIKFYDWDWLGAEREFKRTFELNPNYAQAHLAYGNYLAAMGRISEAIAAKKRALELEPLSLIVNAGLGWTFYTSRQYAEAIKQLRKTLEMDANFQRAHHYLGLAYGQKGMFEEAIAEFQKARTLGDTPETLAWLGTSYALAGKRNEAQKVIGELNELSRRRYVSSYSLAEVYATWGDKDRAFAWLEKAYQEHAFLLVYLKAEPELDSLRSDPRFADLLRRMGLTP